MGNVLERLGHLSKSLRFGHGRGFEPAEFVFHFEDSTVPEKRGDFSAIASPKIRELSSNLAELSFAGLLRAEKACGAIFGAPAPVGATSLGVEFKSPPPKRLKWMILPDRTKLENQYDSSGKLVKICYPDGTTIQYAYNKFGNLSSASSQDGIDIAFSYNDVGQVVKTIYSKTEEFSYAWDPVGNLNRVQYPDLTVAKYEWNRNNMLNSVVCGTEEIRFSRDKASHVRSISLGLGVEYEFHDGEAVKECPFHWQVDKEGKIKILATPFGIWLFDDIGRLRLAINWAGDVKVYRYGIKGRLGSVCSTGGRTSLEYDSDGKVIAIIDPVGFRSLWHPDPMRPILYRIDRSGVSAERYDKKQRLRSIATPTGLRMLFSYDIKGRLSSIYHPLQGITRFDYNGNHTLRSVSTSQGIQIRFEYTAAGNRIEGIICRGRVLDALEVTSQLVESTLLGVGTNFSYEASRGME